MSRLRTVTAVASLAVVALVTAACGSDSSPKAEAATSKQASQPGSTSAPTDVPRDIPAGTALRVGDQLDYLKTTLGTSGQDADFAYKPQYASFVGGPAMLQAFKGGAIDIGYVADTPLIFAQAAHQDIVAIAAWAPEHGSLELIATPGSGIESWEDTKGRKVGYQQGTVLEAAVLQGLDDAGLSLSDIKTVNLPVTEISAALQSHAVDAAVLAPPLDSAYLAKVPDAKVVERADDITDRLTFVVASKKAIEDPAKAAAIRDYVQRIVRAFAWLNAHPKDAAEAVWVKQYHLPLQAGLKNLERVGKTTFLALPGDLIAPQQRLADLYHAAGDIPEKLDVAAEFDDRFNRAVREAVQEAQGR